MFTRVYQTLRDTGTLPGFRIAAERDVNEGVDEEEGIVQMVQSSPRASTRRIARSRGIRLATLHLMSSGRITPRSRAILERLTGLQPVNKLPHCIVTENSVPF